MPILLKSVLEEAVKINFINYLLSNTSLLNFLHNEVEADIKCFCCTRNCICLEGKDCKVI